MTPTFKEDSTLDSAENLKKMNEWLDKREKRVRQWLQWGWTEIEKEGEN